MDIVAPEKVGLDRERLDRVSRWLNDQVTSERLAGCSVMVARYGKIALLEAAGYADREGQRDFSVDSIVRIYSMTKPITTVAAMMLFEEGRFQLDDPVAAYLPEFKDTPVWDGGDADLTAVSTQQRPMTIRDLMTHTSGLTYGFMRANAVDAAYRAADIEMPGSATSLDEWVKRVAQQPLICQPGSAWNYSVSTDVLGRLVEVWSSQSLRDFFLSRILQPLSMRDTDFHVSSRNHARFSALYTPLSGGDMSNVAGGAANSAVEPPGLRLQESADESHFLHPAKVYSGGGGLTGSIGDYARFCQMLLNGGELDGVRLLGRKTVAYMRMNHLPDNRDMAAMGQPVWSETSYDGIGFGLGFAVVVDPVKAQMITSVGEHHWGGAASTFFWLDPQESLFTIFFTQLMPSSTYPIRRELRARVYQAIVD